MKIIDNGTEKRYFDTNGYEIHEGDVVEMDGKTKMVYKTEDGELGTDSTNPIWILTGRAEECEYGVYPFNEDDDPMIVNDTNLTLCW